LAKKRKIPERGHERGRRDRRRGAGTEKGDEADEQERPRRDPLGEPPDVLDPATRLHADDVEAQSDGEERQRASGREEAALLQVREAQAEDVEGEDDGREGEGREIQDVVRPVQPAGEEALPQRDDGKALGYEERDGRQDPERERGRAVGGGQSDPAHADDRRDVEEDDVAGLEGAFECHQPVTIGSKPSVRDLRNPYFHPVTRKRSEAVTRLYE
jgi:hypothetical protein